MSPRANVQSVDAVDRFKPALVRFEGDLSGAITALRTELNRTLQWLDFECPAYWHQQVRTGFDKVAEARTQLMRRQMITVGGHRSECIDEKKALASAKRNLELAQEKVRTCTQWSIKAHRAADEFNAQLGRAEQALAHGVPVMTALLDRIIKALEGYVSPSGRPAVALESTAEAASQTDQTAAPAPAAEGGAPEVAGDATDQTQLVENRSVEPSTEARPPS